MQLYQQVGDSAFTCVANLQPNFLPLESPLVMLSSNQAKAYAKLCYNTDESQVRRFDLDIFMTDC